MHEENLEDYEYAGLDLNKMYVNILAKFGSKTDLTKDLNTVNCATFMRGFAHGKITKNIKNQKTLKKLQML